jgi:serine-type D-Ala-D-Ala carboxypeptidase/endopeptidase
VLGTPCTAADVIIAPVRIRAVFVVVVGLLGGCQEAPKPHLTDVAILEIVRERVQSGQHPGIVVGILENGERRTIAHGVRVTDGDSVDAHTVFEIGSINKVFTAVMLAEMVRRGEVRIDDPVAKFLPSAVRVPERAGRQITLLDLVTHHSGLPRLPGNLEPADRENPYADYTAQDLHRFLSGYRLERDIGERFEYSNLGVGLLGHVLARRADTSYEAALIERVLEPLTLDETRITLTPPMRERLAPGHTAQGRVTKGWDIGALTGAGGLRSTADDMLTFAAAHFDSSGVLFASLRTALRAQRPIERGGRDSVGLGWMLMRQNGHPVAWHNGGTGGYRSFLGLDREGQWAVVVLTNSAVSVDDIGMMLLEQMRERTSK